MYLYDLNLATGIHCFKVIVRNRNINLMKGDTLHKNSTVFPCGTGLPHYLKKLTFSALIEHVFKKHC